MSVKMKLIALLVVSMAGFALVFAADKAGSLAAGRMAALEKATGRIQIAVLQCRRQEKNFLLRRDDTYAGRFDKALAEARSSLAEVASASTDEAERLTQAGSMLDAYEASFRTLADIIRTIGLTEKDGLRWQFISAARAMEAQFKGKGGPDMLIALLQLRRQEKNFMIRRTETYLNRARDKEAVVRRLVDSIEVDDATRTAMSASLDGYSKAFEGYVRLVAESDAAKAALIDKGRALEPVVAAIRDGFIAKQAALDERTSIQMLGIEVGTVLVIAFISVWVILSVTRPLHSLADYAHEVADGNLDAEPKGEFRAEFGRVRSDIASMVDELKRQLDEVREKREEARRQADSAREAMLEATRQQEHAMRLRDKMRASAVRAEAFSSRVTDSAEELAAMISQVKRGAMLQTERMEQTASAMEQMNNAVLDVARNAGQASENARDTKAKAQNGAKLVQNAVTAIATVNDHTGNMRQGMENLERQVESIGRVMDVISEIADQTNLLALNAAIEAARAGDAGRGFAVVADEVRKLAEKTMEATQEVGRSIDAIRDATGRNIDNTRQAVMAVEESTRLAMETGAAQEEILRLVDDNSIQVDGIASASEQQSATSDQINGAVSEVRTIAEESLEGMHRSYEAVQALTSLSGELRAMIEDMLTDDDSPELAQAS